MASLVLTVLLTVGMRDQLEGLAERIEPGDDWSDGDRHVVAVHLTLPAGTVAGLGEIDCDVDCRDNPPKSSYLARPYTLFGATGDFDAAMGEAHLRSLARWIATICPGAEPLQAGISASEESLVLLPDGDGWRISERY